MLNVWYHLLPIQFNLEATPLLISGIVVSGLAVGSWFAWRITQHVKQRTHPRIAHVIFVGTVVALLCIAGSTLLTAWNAVEQAIILLQPLSGLLSFSVRIGLSVAVLILAYIGTGIVNKILEQHIEHNERLSQHQSEVAFRVSALGVYAVGLIAVLGFWNIDVRGLLISAGFLGIVVGMAARQTLGSLLAGFVLMFSRPFEIGDWIEIQDEEGIVTEITIFTTRIQTFDGKYVMIPNDIVAGSKVTNLRRRGRLRTEVEIGIDYNADPDRAMEIAERTMQDLQQVVSTPRPQAVLKGFGDSAVIVGLLFWIDKPNPGRKWRTQTAVIRAVKEAYEKEGIHIPFPQQALSVRDDASAYPSSSDEQSMSERTSRTNSP